MIRTSCPDCLVSYSNFTLGENVYHNLQLLSRRTEVSAEEKEEFKKQVECLNLPQVTFVDSKTGLCPDPFTSPNSESIDVTKNLENFEFSQMAKILTSSKAVEKLTDLVTSQLLAQGKHRDPLRLDSAVSVCDCRWCGEGGSTVTCAETKRRQEGFLGSNVRIGV
ncbi:hypothetical protein FQA47_003236 [Oryzias melastigma]|uniref:Uncharacterized protein n=1 Tax=Oryzias melastigma TaxID=30732 RepID=A0A834FPH0_ORYME|nr:hypothetical protein FQA47_003236 [Oryzias melastigma]